MQRVVGVLFLPSVPTHSGFLSFVIKTGFTICSSGGKFSLETILSSSSVGRERAELVKVLGRILRAPLRV